MDLENALVRVEPGVTNLDVSQAPRARGLLLRARPLLAERLHDRRQRLGELGRRALPEVRVHVEPRARRARRARGRLASWTSGVPSSTGRATTSWESSSGARACSASSRRSSCASCASPRRRARSSRRSPRRRGGQRRVGDHRVGHRPGRDRDDGPPRDRAAIAATGLDWPDVGAALLMDVDGPARRGRAHVRERDRARAPRRARSRSAARRTRTSGCSCGRGARARSPPSGRISPNYIVQDGVIPRSRDRRGPRARSRSSRAKPGLRVANVFHAGDGNLHPLVLYDARVPGQEKARRGARRRDPEAVPRARRLDHGRARRRRRQGRLHGRDVRARTDLETMHRVRCAFDPERAPQPGQGLPDAAPVRRPARAVHVPHPAELSGEATRG